MRLAAAAGGESTVIPFPSRLLDDGLAEELANPDLAALLGTPVGADDEGADAATHAAAVGGAGSPTAGLLGRRPLLVGGAVTSAALSLAGAAFVAWRLTRGAPTDPMARAVRLARAAGPPATRSRGSSPDADHPALPPPPRELSARHVDPVPGLLRDALQQAPRQAMRVCPSCGHHFRVSAATRLAQLLDPGTFRERDAGLVSQDPMGFVDSKAYVDRLVGAQTATGGGTRPRGATARSPGIGSRSAPSTSRSWAAPWARSWARR